MLNISQILIALATILVTECQYLVLSQSSQLSKSFTNSKIPVKSSPIGFKPKIGSLHGRVVLANPLSACEELNQEDFGENQDVFIMADDAGCMESIKAKNIAATGAYIGIIKRNINNTLKDKQISMVHILILQMQPSQFNKMTSYMLAHKQETITLLADFNPQQKAQKKIKMELWFSPNQVQAYSFINQFSAFLTEQADLIEFHPRFVLHSQAKNVQYIGCLSSGRFCPPDLQFQGRPEGAKIVKESLRQIIVAEKNIKNWFKYASIFASECLTKSVQTLWQQENSEICSENVMMNAQIDPHEIFAEYNQSFLGSRPQVDSNTYLEEQRQLFIDQKITKIPTLLINGKPYSVDESPRNMKVKICNMLNPNPEQQSFECQKITNPSLFSYGQLMIIFALFINLLVCLMVGCRIFLKRRMTSEIQSEVEDTLQQYYRYMQTFQGPNPHSSHQRSDSSSRANQNMELQEYMLAK